MARVMTSPHSLHRTAFARQLAEATGIADEATVSSWVAQCCPDLATDAPAPLEPVLRYLDDTYLPDPANWPGDNPYDEFVLETLPHTRSPALLLTPFGADRSGNYRELSRSLRPSC